MSNNKILEGDIYTHNFSPDERKAVLKLREYVRKLTRGETMALAAILLNAYSLTLNQWRLTEIVARQEFTKDLANAVLQISVLASPTQLVIAIELLESERESKK